MEGPVGSPAPKGHHAQPNLGTTSGGPRRGSLSPGHTTNVARVRTEPGVEQTSSGRFALRSVKAPPGRTFEGSHARIGMTPRRFSSRWVSTSRDLPPDLPRDRGPGGRSKNDDQWGFQPALAAMRRTASHPTTPAKRWTSFLTTSPPPRSHRFGPGRGKVKPTITGTNVRRDTWTLARPPGRPSRYARVVGHPADQRTADATVCMGSA